MYIIGIRIIAEVATEEAAIALIAHVESLMREFGDIEVRNPEPYWKFPGNYDCGLSIDVDAAAIAATYSGVLNKLGDGWRGDLLFENDEANADWNYGDGQFCHEAIRFIWVSAFPRSAIVDS